MQQLCLDRRIITGKIDCDIPHCVLVDIANGNGFVRPEEHPHHALMHHLTDATYSVPIIGISASDSIMEGENYNVLLFHSRKIAAFVNSDKNIGWTLNNLVDCLMHMFSVNVARPIIPEQFDVGSQTTTSKFSYNACMLYRICKSYNIDTRPSMTLEHLADCVTSLSDLKYGRSVVPRQLEDLFSLSEDGKDNYTDLIIKSCVALSKVRAPSISRYEIENVTFDDFKECYDKLNLNCLLLRVTPVSHNEAVLIAALSYGMDISSSRVPMAELTQLRLHGDAYCPVDRQFRSAYERNVEWFLIKKTYAPLLSMLYDNSALKIFLEAEAVSPEEMREIEMLAATPAALRTEMRNKLYQLRLTTTFYPGWHPNSVNHVTPIELEDLTSTRDTATCVTVGSLEYRESLTVYKLTELADYFESCRDFINPHNVQENFSNGAIAKLKLLCRNSLAEPRPLDSGDRVITKSNPAAAIISRTARGYNQRGRSALSPPSPNSRAQISGSRSDDAPMVNSVVRRAYQKLLDAIDKVEANRIALNTKAQSLKRVYLGLKKEEQVLVIETLTKLLEAGMCMRGWKVSSPNYPLISKDTVTPVGMQHQVDVEVNASLHSFSDYIDKLNVALARRIKNLTLVCIQDSPGKVLEFKQSSEPKNGLTIWDRYNIVIKGEESDNMSSCIRLTSNWFVSSAYYYLVALGLERPFDITQLAKIS